MKNATCSFRSIAPVWGLAVLAMLFSASAIFAQADGPNETEARDQTAEKQPPESTPAAPSQETAQEPEPAEETVETDPLFELMEELQIVLDQLQSLRIELAQARLERNEAFRQLDELQQFMEDNAQLGNSYQEYRGVKEVAEREARQRQIETRRAEYEREKAARKVRYQQARAERMAERAEQQRLSGYDRAGFAGIGLDVYASRMSYYYFTSDTTRRRVDWEDGIGHYLRLYPSAQIDFSKMTISGSIMNAADETRNLGIAIVFFDNNNTQVGHEIVQINNARPDVPYPFTSEVQLALNRPFATSSVYVLYADPIVNDSGAAQTNGEGP